MARFPKTIPHFRITRPLKFAAFIAVGERLDGFRLLLHLFVVGALKFKEERRKSGQSQSAEGIRSGDLDIVEKLDSGDRNAALEDVDGRLHGGEDVGE